MKNTQTAQIDPHTRQGTTTPPTTRTSNSPRTSTTPAPPATNPSRQITDEQITEALQHPSVIATVRSILTPAGRAGDIEDVLNDTALRALTDRPASTQTG